MVRFDQGAGGGGEQDGRWKMDEDGRWMMVKGSVI
jgi:hypothetical protein